MPLRSFGWVGFDSQSIGSERICVRLGSQGVSNEIFDGADRYHPSFLRTQSPTLLAGRQREITRRCALVLLLEEVGAGQNVFLRTTFREVWGVRNGERESGWKWCGASGI